MDQNQTGLIWNKYLTQLLFCYFAICILRYFHKTINWEFKVMDVGANNGINGVLQIIYYWSSIIEIDFFHQTGQWEEHGSMLHCWHSKSSPTQSTPPNWGGGLSHLLDLVWSPPPHSAVHGPHSSQSLNPPSTVSKIRQHVIWNTGLIYVKEELFTRKCIIEQCVIYLDRDRYHILGFQNLYQMDMESLHFWVGCNYGSLIVYQHLHRLQNIHSSHPIQTIRNFWYLDLKHTVIKNLSV